MLTSTAIWPPDWSQFVPDIITSLVIGLGVGIAIWRFQSTAEERAAKRSALGSWKILRENLAWRFEVPLDPHDLHAEYDSMYKRLTWKDSPETSERIGELLAVAQEERELQLLSRHLQDVERLGRLAGRVEDALVRDAKQSVSLIGKRLDHTIALAWHLIRGTSEVELLALSWFTDTSLQGARFLLEEDETSELVRSYVDLERTVVSQYNELRKLLTHQ